MSGKFSVAGPAIEAPGIPWPTFLDPVDYETIKEIGRSADFLALRDRATLAKEER